MKKKQITIIALGCVLVALILLYFLVVAPLIDRETESSSTAQPEEGEGLYYGILAMYPEINLKDVSLITINNEYGTYSFKTAISESSGSYSLVLSDYPRLKLDDTALANLRVYTLNSQCRSNEPIRNCSPETMAQYGVTKETCKLSFTVNFTEDDEQKSYTVYIGDKTLSSSGSYFATVEGRDVIYEIDSGLEDGLMLAKEEFVSPTIVTAYNSTDVVYAIHHIMIGESNAETPFIGIEATRRENKDSISVNYSVMFPTSAANVTANASYIGEVLSSLLVNFIGDRVVEINPDEQTRAKYGLGASDVKKVIEITPFELEKYVFTISSKMTDADGNEWYYVMIPKDEDTGVSLIIRITAEGYEFLESENAIKWVATNSVDAGFTEYIYKNEDEDASGVADITITSNTNALSDFKDKFILTYAPHPTDSTAEEVLTVTTESGRYTFADNLDAVLSEDKNQFNNFYAILVNYPMPNRFNTMSEEEREAVKTEENLIFSLRVTMNDGTKLGYDYYLIDSANVMCEFFDGKITEPTVVFDTTLQHINILATALDQLISGEKVEKR